MLATLRAKLPKSDPVIEEGNKEGYGFIHLFGGIWGASEKPTAIRNWVYHVPGSRYDSPGTIKALARLQEWAKAGYFNTDYNAVGYDAAAGLFAKGKGAMWIGGDWDSTIIKAASARERRRDADSARAERPVGRRSAGSPGRGTSRRRRRTPTSAPSGSTT